MQLGQIVEFKGQDRAGLVVGIIDEIVRVAEYIKQGKVVILRILDIVKDSGIVQLIDEASNTIQELVEDLSHIFRRLPDVLDINGVEYKRTLQPKAGRKGIDAMFYMNIDGDSVEVLHEVEHSTMTGCRRKMRDLLKEQYGN